MGDVGSRRLDRVLHDGPSSWMNSVEQDGNMEPDKRIVSAILADANRLRGLPGQFARLK